MDLDKLNLLLVVRSQPLRSSVPCLQTSLYNSLWVVYQVHRPFFTGCPSGLGNEDSCKVYQSLFTDPPQQVPRLPIRWEKMSQARANLHYYIPAASKNSTASKPVKTDLKIIILFCQPKSVTHSVSVTFLKQTFSISDYFTGFKLTI